jgi:outer membrane protein OmpA-like peptidoglycan-associated protein
LPATQQIFLTIVSPPPPLAPHTQESCSISFTNDKKRPSRVDNEAKACLDQVALSLQQQSDATLVIVGESADSSQKAPNLAAQRAVNTKDYLVREKGMDNARITVCVGSGKTDEVHSYLVPAGANFSTDLQGTQSVDEKKVKPVSRYRHDY